LDPRDELSDLLFEVVRFACECLDAPGGAAQHAHGGAVLDVAGGAITELGAVGDLGVAGPAAQFDAKVFGRADDQRREVVDGGGAGGDSAGPGGDEDAEGFWCTAAARLDEMVAAEDFAGGADRVEGVALAGASPWWGLGRQTSTTRSPCPIPNAVSPAP
jgi:hypothetical protein